MSGVLLLNEIMYWFQSLNVFDLPASAQLAVRWISLTASIWSRLPVQRPVVQPGAEVEPPIPQKLPFTAKAEAEKIVVTSEGEQK